MADYRVTDTQLTSIANAIRTKGETSSALEFPDGFVSAVQDIPTGGGSVLVTKTITQNGTYNAEDDNADGYSEVIVNVQAATRVIYAFHIDSAESNPSARVTYLEDAVGMTPAHMDYANGVFDYGSWENAFFMPKPCMVLQSGSVDYYLDPDDYTKKADGTASDVANTSYAGNAMMEWGRDGKKIWYKVVPDENDVTSGTVYISNEQVDSDYHDWSFINNQGVEVDHFYTPIYNGSNVNNVIRSLSGLTISNSINATTEISRCLANNTESDTLWYTEVLADRILINFLLVLIGKSTNTQAVFGNGITILNQTQFNAITTGSLNDKGLFFGYNNSDAKCVKVFGMENWWGTQNRRIAGYIGNSNKNQLIKLTYGQQDGSTVNGYNTNGSGYISTGIIPSIQAGYSGGNIKQMSFNEYGMFPSNLVGGSTSTYYCDDMEISENSYGACGGDTEHSNGCGAFNVDCTHAISFANWKVGVSLSFKPSAV